MRLSDLISFIRLASEQFDQDHLSEEIRLRMIKMGFPRPDLLAWIDEEIKQPVAPLFYFPCLLISVAAQIALREDRSYEVACAAPADLAMLEAFPRPPHASLTCLPLTPEGATPDIAWPLVNQIGLIYGVFSDPRQSAALRSLRAVPASHAYKLFIMSAEFCRAWRSTDGAVDDPEALFTGILQYWGTHKYYLFYSCGSEFEVIRNTKTNV